MAILNPFSLAFAWETYADLIATGLTAIAVFAICSTPQRDRYIDWSLNEYYCGAGEEINVMVTNFTGLEVFAKAGALLWNFVGAEPQETYACHWKDEDRRIKPGESRIWAVSMPVALVPKVYYIKVGRNTVKPSWHQKAPIALDKEEFLAVPLVVGLAH